MPMLTWKVDDGDAETIVLALNMYAKHGQDVLQERSKELAETIDMTIEDGDEKTIYMISE